MQGGLKIMPGAGGRVGAGLYFADEAGKSGYYTRGDAAGEAVMFLVECGLGEQHLVESDSYEAQRLRKAPRGYQSVQACCATGGPARAGDVKIKLDGREVVLATGTVRPPTPQDIDACGAGRSSFLQNEYLVYNDSQVRLRYVVKINLNGRTAKTSAGGGGGGGGGGGRAAVIDLT